jgi:hypothetical protein
VNQTFTEYATSTAFSISLSKHQCNCLLRAELDTDLWALTVGSMRALEARGLVNWHVDENGRACGFAGLTEAGKLMVGLIKQAGLTIESTNTVSVIRRMAREAA